MRTPGRSDKLTLPGGRRDPHAQGLCHGTELRHYMAGSTPLRLGKVGGTGCSCLRFGGKRRRLPGWGRWRHGFHHGQIKDASRVRRIVQKVQNIQHPAKLAAQRDHHANRHVHLVGRTESGSRSGRVAIRLLQRCVTTLVGTGAERESCTGSASSNSPAGHSLRTREPGCNGDSGLGVGVDKHGAYDRIKTDAPRAGTPHPCTTGRTPPCRSFAVVRSPALRQIQIRARSQGCAVTASTSISTRYPSPISAPTCSSVLAGRISPK